MLEVIYFNGKSALHFGRKRCFQAALAEKTSPRIRESRVKG